ncbi:MAG: carboxypeptidase-like regulatory domain-containing protein [Bacteroidetes bacterium]|nr:carboxypeptidase-like regulatory domain-containing protein [Bacteroidota bacterium]
MKLLSIAFLFLFSGMSFAQSYKVSGKIVDTKNNKGLEYVTIKVADTTYGTISDKDGNYFIALNPGKYKIIYSYIGYKTSTEDVEVYNEDIKKDIYMDPSGVFTEQIEVLGEDPAYEIIRKVIKTKKSFQENLKQYEYDAYSKFVIRSNQSVADKKSDKVNDTTTDKKKLGIFGILESETKGYFRRPDQYKEIVKSKRETANITRGFAIPLIVNFYDEKLDFDEFKVPGPVADNAFDNYEYKLLGTTTLDTATVFKIEMTNNSNIFPQLKGILYVLDGDFALVKVDLTNNDAAKLRAIDNIRFFQKFSNYKDKQNKSYWLPTDNQIEFEGSFLGFVKFAGNANSIVSNYTLNEKIPDGIFNETVVQVLPNAKKDSVYFSQKQLISSTPEENKAFRDIEKDEKKKDKEVSFQLTQLKFGKHVTSQPLQYYYFNRVEGSALNFNLNYRSDFNRTGLDGNYSYGFADKKQKYEIRFSQRFLKDRTLSFNGSVFQKLKTTNVEYGGLGRFYNTLTSWFDRNDAVDYYYSTGYDLGLNYLPIPQIRIGVNFLQSKETTANKNTDWSIRKPDEFYRTNPPINDAFQRVIGVNLRLDPNKYKFIDYGDGNVSRFTDTRFPYLDLGFQYSPKDIGSTYEYRKFKAVISGSNYLNSLLNLKYRVGAEYGTGDIPYQSLMFFNTDPGLAGGGLGFKALRYQEFLGDKSYFVNIENNFGKFIFGNVPILKNFDFIAFVNADKMEISNNNYQLASWKNFLQTDGTYLEIGGGVARILDIFRVNLAMRLNNINDSRWHIDFALDNF